MPIGSGFAHDPPKLVSEDHCFDSLAGMRFEIISNDLKCILFEKYGFLKIKSPIHVYQYEIPLPRLFMNLTQECILSLCPLYLTLLWTLLHCIYTESGPHRHHRQLFQALLLPTVPRVFSLALGFFD